MAASNKCACLPLLLLASFISLASAARILPLHSTVDHSFISASSSPSDDLDWLSVTALKRKLSVTPSQYATDDDQSSVSTRIGNAALSYPIPYRKWLLEKDQGVMSDEDVQTKNVVDEDGSFRFLNDKEIDELMDDLEDVGMDNADSGFNANECGTEECGWSQGNAGSSYGWGWNQGGGSSYGQESGGSGGDNGSGGGGWGGGGIGSIGRGWGGGGIGGLGGGGGGGGIGGGGGGGGGIGGIGGGGGGGIGGIGGGGHIGGIGWDWGIGNIGGGGGSTGRDAGGGSTGGIGWDWGIGNIGGGGGNGGKGGVNLGGSSGSGRDTWHWGWPWGGGSGKLVASNDLNPNIGASGRTTDTAK